MNEATKNLQLFYREYDELIIAGGAESPSPELKRLATGEFLSAIMSDLRDQRRAGEKGEGYVSLENTRRAEHRSFPGAEVALQTCVDGTRTKGLDQSGKVIYQGHRSLLTAYFKRSPEGILQLFDGESHEVATCAS